MGPACIVHFSLVPLRHPHLVMRLNEIVYLLHCCWETFGSTSRRCTPVRGCVNSCFLLDDPPPFEDASLGEAKEFLHWIEDNHFTFLGFLEYSLEESYNRLTLYKKVLNAEKVGVLARSYISHWQPKKRPYQPALVLNTTEVGSGTRRVFSPFIFCQGNTKAQNLPLIVIRTNGEGIMLLDWDYRGRYVLR